MSTQLRRAARVLILPAAFLFLLVAVATAGQATGLTIAVLEDFDDIVTVQDLGFDDFSGNMGLLNQQYVTTDPADPLTCQEEQCAYRFAWDFDADTEVFTGYFFSVFGLTDTLVTFDGTITETLTFPNHYLNLDQIDGALDVPARAFTEICLDVSYDEPNPLTLRLELGDVDGGRRFRRVAVPGTAAPQNICWDFRADFGIPAGDPNADVTRAKLFSLIVEERNVGAGITNPTTGALEIDRVYFTLDTPETRPTDDAWADLAARRAYQHFLDWSSRDPRSLDLPQDRSTFGDLLTVGGVGFAIPAHITAAENGWISRAAAAERVHNILSVLDDESAFGEEATGRIGYRGWFYHFLGVDGKRKLNFDFPETPVNESLNTVELSSIDTGLAMMGVLAAQSYFTDTVGTENEIRTMAQSIYDRVEWDFMVEPNSSQFFLGWKPDETYEGPPFEYEMSGIPGGFSGSATDPATLDFYTDEALLLILLGVGSRTHPLDPDVYTGLQYAADGDGFIRTFPGALFTYQFLPAFVDTSSWPGVCANVDWHENARRAVWRTIDYAENDTTYSTYGPDAWGLSAAEGAFDDYQAFGAPPVAVANDPEENGTVTYYGMISAAGLGPDLHARAIQAVDAGWDRGHWHPRFGLPDAFHADVSEIPNPPASLLRGSGPWIGRATFAIDQGPQLLHLENARSGLIWQLMAANPNVRRGLARLNRVSLEAQGLQAEDGSGDGAVMSRSRAWGGQTVLLQDGQSRLHPFSTGCPAEEVVIFVRYSNDNVDTGPFETIDLRLDGVTIGSFVAADTGSGGFGWDIFTFSPIFSTGPLPAGNHVVEVMVSGGDGFGVELDIVLVNTSHTREDGVTLPVVRRAGGG